MGKIIERVSLGLDGAEANGASKNAVMTPDGRYIVFESDASNLVAGDTNGVSDIFRYDTTTGDIVRVSVGDGTGAAGDSSNATVTADGRYIAFESLAENLITTDTNDLRDVFVRDMETGVTSMVSGRPEMFLQSEGGTYGSSNPTIVTLAGDTYVAFSSDATNLVGDDTNGTRDVFLKVINYGAMPHVYGAISRVSNNNSGAQSDGFSGPYTSIAPGPGELLIAFSSQANLTSDSSGTDVGAPPDFPDGYPVPPTTEAMELYLTDGVYTNIASVQTGGSVSGDGHSIEATLAYPYIIYTTGSTNLYGSNDTNGVNDVYVYNYQTQTVTLVSMGMDGMAGNGESGGYARIWVAADNTPHATFSSAASNLVAGDTNEQIDFFLRDLGGIPKTILLSDPGHGVVSDGASTGFSSGGANFSTSGAPYGSFVFTSSATNMVSGDTNGFTDIFHVVRITEDAVVAISGDQTAATEQVAVVVDAGVAVSDEDSATLTQAIVTITGNYQQGQDVLQFTTIGTITGVFDPLTGKLTLTGTATVAEYQEALRTIKYLNTSDAPYTGDRTITFVVDDGVDFSAPAPKTVSVTAVNDVPTDIVLTGTSVWEYEANTTVVGTLSTVDVDIDNFTYTLLDDAGGRFVLVGDEIRVADGLLIDFEQQASHKVKVLVTDDAGLTHTETLTITVTDLNPETVVGDDDGNAFVGGSGNDKLSGRGGSDILIGNAGNDTLDAGADAVVDVLIGGLGSDTYVLNNGKNDVVMDEGGIDTVTSTITRALSGTLSSIENLRLLGGAAKINGTGNGLNNTLIGNDGANVLKGLGGNDRLDGGAGKDAFYGGTGADIFIFDQGDTAAGKAQADTIFDMQGTSGDHIDLHLIDASTKKGGNQTFTFIGTDKFGGHAGELRYQVTKSDTYIFADTNGDKQADFTIHLDDAMALQSGFFGL